MATLTKTTIQRLAVLRAIAKWQQGAFGPVRIHKTLFFSDKGNDEEWRIFPFRRWYLGQYSDRIAELMNDLRKTGRLKCHYDGPSEKIIANIGATSKVRINSFFSEYFPEWSQSLSSAFHTWGYMTNDAILQKAHDDPTYTESHHGEMIFDSSLPERVEFTGLSQNDAEELTDLVEPRLHSELRKRLAIAVGRPIQGEDWRSIYFDK